MPRVLQLALLLTVFVLPLGCASTPKLEAVSDFDRTYDFTSARSFSILPIDRTSAAERLISDMQVSRIEEALSAELVRRGYHMAPSREEADLYLSWHLVTREKTDIRSYNASSAYQCWRCGPPVSDVTVRQYTEGTFIVDLIDPLRNRSVWRSTIQSRISAAPVTDEARQLAAEAVLAPYPPEPSGAE